LELTEIVKKILLGAPHVVIPPTRRTCSGALSLQNTNERQLAAEC
jgi:hypothetical protein